MPTIKTIGVNSKRTSRLVYFTKCFVCESMFESLVKSKKYCSSNCKELYRNRKDSRKEYLKQWHKTHPRKKKIKIICAKLLQSKVFFKRCVMTNVLFTSKTKKIMYAPLIRKQIESIKGWIHYINNKDIISMKARLEYTEKICVECNSVYLSNTMRQSHCSTGCSKRQMNRIRRGIERARKKGSVAESVDHNKVFNSYGWVCNICGCDTPIELRGKFTDNAPEMDHIIPYSKGGEHSYANTQLLCRSCNRIKSNDIL